MNNETVINALGWIGTISYLIAFALVSMKKVEADSLAYQGINIFAGVLLVINTLHLRAYPSLGLNAAWIAIAAFSLWRRWLSR